MFYFKEGSKGNLGFLYSAFLQTEYINRLTK